LGLSSHPEVVQAAKDALDTWIRNVIGAFYLRYSRYPQNFREKIAEFYGTEDIFFMQLLMQMEDFRTIIGRRRCYNFR
jgi:7-keto-8-aminopelargonate synthetase-like enzyme